ncbi:MAG: TonB-dependent receptor [Sinimarinibacterium sp.]|jgi:outer membrane receptor protein involved in Fe transport
MTIPIRGVLPWRAAASPKPLYPIPGARLLLLPLFLTTMCTATAQSEEPWQPADGEAQAADAPSQAPADAPLDVIAVQKVEEDDASPEPPAKRPPPVLEEIVVTAQKRPEDIQSVPLSVTAISGDNLTEMNMGDMNEVANHVPNLDVLAIPTFPSIYMRGLGSSYNRGFEQSVALLIDEVFYGRASYINQGLLDLDAVEVLRGPQGTLFGKNSSAGAIHFRTAMPESDFSTKGDVLLGSLDSRRYRLISTGPLGDTLNWRMALLDERRDGDIHNTTTGVNEENRDNQSGRLRLQWSPDQNLAVGLTLNAGFVGQDGPGAQLTKARDRHLAAMLVFDPQTSDDPYDERSAMDHRAGVDRETYDSTLRADWTLDSGTVLTSISNYAWLDEIVHFDADASPVPFLVLDNNERLRQFSQELRLTSEPGELEYVAGAYFLRNDLNATYDITDYLELTEILLITGEAERIACINTSSDPKTCQDAILDDSNSGRAAGETIQARMSAQGGASPVETSLTRFGQLTDSAALFGQATWHFSEAWGLTLGARLNYEKKSLDVVHRLINNQTGVEGSNVTSGGQGVPLLGGYGLGNNPGGSIIFPIIIAGDTPFSAQRDRHDLNVIPKASLQYDFDDSAMAYASVAQGYKSGGYNAQPVNDQQIEFDEENALTYEIGVKSTWLGGAARLNVSAFRTDFEGLQVATFNGVAYVVGNAASATIQGIEYEGMLITPLGVLLGLNGAYTDAHYDDFRTAPCAAEVTDAPPCDLSGRRLRLAPRIKSTLVTGWQVQPFDLPVMFSAGVTASYTSEVALATDLDPIDIREGGTTFGVQMGVRSILDRWHVSLFGDNVSNQESLAAAQDAPAYRGSHFGGAYPFAIYELEVGFHF